MHDSPTLDLQQLATHARDSSLMTADDIAVTVLAEVASGKPHSSLVTRLLYPGRPNMSLVPPHLTLYHHSTPPTRFPRLNCHLSVTTPITLN
jgi:hypothetical protein